MLLEFLLFLPALQAPQQAPADATLEQLLQSLQQNVGLYIHSLPNLYCDEHVTSIFTPHTEGSVPRQSVVDATFRIRRPPDVKTLADLKESRDIKLVDGLPTVDELGFPRDIELPLLILGVFANAPALFSPSLAPCFDFRLGTPRKPDPPDAYVIEFASVPPRLRPATCPNDHPSSGRAILDHATLHLIHLEKTTPRFPIYPQTKGTWNWTVDYAPTDLAGQTFWLPSHIFSRSVADGTHSTWTFDGTYAKYHRLFATSKIVPNSAPVTKP